MRLFLSLCITLFMCIPFARADDLHKHWELLKKDYITADGRVIDNQNSDMSHSEGQGYILFLAQYFDERELFDRVLAWSENNLGRDLKAWSWGKAPNGQWTVLDTNNATDGDMLHAWALLLAGEKWKDIKYTSKGFDLLKHIRTNCITGGGVILPGRYGFIKPEGIVINPSYYIFPALRAFIRFDPANAQLWQQVLDYGLHILTDAEWAEHIPTDWILLTQEGRLIPYPPEKASFGYAAVRIPLYLSSEQRPDLLGVFKQYIRNGSKNNCLPAYIATHQNIDCSTEEAGFGYYAIMARIANTLHMSQEYEVLSQIAQRKINEKGTYYDTVLTLLAAIL